MLLVLILNVFYESQVGLANIVIVSCKIKDEVILIFYFTSAWTTQTVISLGNNHELSRPDDFPDDWTCDDVTMPQSAAYH